ncbi:MAG: TIGR02678 family protein [Solirubrobacteraceae bacterium]
MSSSLRDASAEDRQRAARALLARGVLLAGDPLFRNVRRHKEQLASDFRDRLGYSLQISTDMARLYKPLLLSHARPLTVPARNRSESRRPVDERRVLDARRCLMICLACAVLERRTLWTQVPLTELAEDIAQEARSLELELDWKLAADRSALLDSLTWLGGLGVLTLRSGAEGAFGESVDVASEAYYDIDRPRLAGVLAEPLLVAGARCTRDLEAPSTDASGTDTSDTDVNGTSANGGSAGRREPSRFRAQRLTRRLVEDPAVYLEDLSEPDRQYFLSQRGPLERRAGEISGLAVERRREGSALIATGRELSDRPFPARSHRKQLALLLLAELCSLDERRRAERPDGEPDASVWFADERVLELVRSLLVRHRDHWGFAPDDPAEVYAAAAAAVTLLEELLLLRRGPDGIQLRPAAHRYRESVATVTEQPSLFDDAELLREPVL